jgi:importin subunit beta-1
MDEASFFSDRVMALVYQITQFYLNNSNVNASISNSTTVVEDAFLLVSALINSIGKKFIRYIDHFLPDLSKVLKQQQQQIPISNDKMTLSSSTVISATDEEHRLSLISVGIMSDISNTFGDLIFPYAGEFMRLLLNNLKSESLHRDVKPATLSCIGDIAQALGPVFVPFVDTVMMAIKQAGNMQADKNNQDMMDYVDTIRVGSLEAFVGMIQGLGQNAATKEILLPFVTDVILFANSIAVDEKRSDRLTRTIIGLLG